MHPTTLLLFVVLAIATVTLAAPAPVPQDDNLRRAWNLPCFKGFVCKGDRVIPKKKIVSRSCRPGVECRAKRHVDQDSDSVDVEVASFKRRADGSDRGKSRPNRPKESPMLCSNGIKCKRGQGGGSDDGGPGPSPRSGQGDSKDDPNFGRRDGGVDGNDKRSQYDGRLIINGHQVTRD